MQISSDIYIYIYLPQQKIITKWKILSDQSRVALGEKLLAKQYNLSVGDNNTLNWVKSVGMDELVKAYLKHSYTTDHENQTC